MLKTYLFDIEPGRLRREKSRVNLSIIIFIAFYPMHSRRFRLLLNAYFLSGLAALSLIIGGYMMPSPFWKRSSTVEKSNLTSVLSDTISPLQRLDAQGQLHPALFKLFYLTGITLEVSSPFDTLVDQAQTHWYQGGKERWLLEGESFTPEKQEEIIELLRRLNLIQTIHAQYRGEVKYDYVLVHGALGQSIQNRLKNLNQAYQEGVRFKAVVLLTGARPLIPGKEDKWIALGIKAEADLFQYLWQEEDYSRVFEKSYTLIDTPGMTALDHPGKLSIKRPGTEDTLKLWLNTQRPQPGSKILAISNQPYIIYQHAILKRCLRQYCIDNQFDESQFHIETIGAESTLPHGEKAQYIATHLDNLARYLFEERKLKSMPQAQPRAFQMRCA
jgi:hypothetical protein